MTLQEKITKYFDGKVVRKDLAKGIKGNAVVPMYVLEYLLGQHCASFDDQIITQGVEKVKEIVKNHFVHRDEAEVIKSIIREKGQHKVIDKVTVKLNEKNDYYEAEFSNLGIKRVHVDDDTIKKHPKLLTGGVWCIVELGYLHSEERGSVPWILVNLKPIQVSNINIDEFKELRQFFTKEEWGDLLMQSIGLNPENFTFRGKLIQLTRLVSFCENNFNLIELGPKGTGKSHVFSELSPHGILISGGDVTQAKLFVNNATGNIGLVGYWDCVAFDEFAGKEKRVDRKLVDIMKNYMANKSFSRGRDIYGATASMAFVGNTEHSVPYMLKHSDLFDALPKGYYDTAFLDRIHHYIPGWEVQKLNYEMFTDGYGFIVDYLAEALRELRKEDYSTLIKNHFTLNDTLTSRDRDGITKTFSGLAKIIFPDGKCTREEVKELLEFAIEGRKRVKNQLIKIDDTFELVSFDFTDSQSGEVFQVETLENIENNFTFVPNRPGSQPIMGSEEKKDYTSQTKPEPELMAGQVIIRENQTGISYDKLFNRYLKGARQITLKDPYIRLPYQMKLLLEFCHLLSTLKKEEEEINLTVITWNDEEHLEESRQALTEIADSVFDIGINFKFILDEGHDRTIETDNGWKIILGRGLDIFQRVESRFSIADMAQERRLCKGCEVTFIKVEK